MNIFSLEHKGKKNCPPFVYLNKKKTKNVPKKKAKTVKKISKVKKRC